MTKHGYGVIVLSANTKEEADPSLSPEETVKTLALQKALATQEMLSQNPSLIKEAIRDFDDCPEAETLDFPILAADTIVYLDEIIGKPKDKEDALKILMNLSGKEHKVYTGVAILPLKKDTDSPILFSEETSVFFKSYTEEDLAEYLETDEAYDKAGAYAIQGYFGKFIDRIEGDYENVMGLPVYRLSDYL